MLYRAISRHPPVHERYLQRLIEQQNTTRAEAERIVAEYRAFLEKELQLAESEHPSTASQAYGGIWSGYSGGLESNGAAITHSLGRAKWPICSKLKRIFRRFSSSSENSSRGRVTPRDGPGKRPLDWAAAEALALPRWRSKEHGCVSQVRTPREEHSASATPCCTT